MDPFNQPLRPLLGEKTAEQFAKHLGIATTGQALNYFPRRYIERGELTPIVQLPVGEQVTVIARVQSAKRRKMHTRKGFLMDVTVTDEASDTGLPGTLSMAFFNGWAAEQQLTPGTLAMFHGKTSTYRGDLTLTNPDFTVLPDEHDHTEVEIVPIPVYPAKAKLPSWTIRSAIEIVLEAINWAAIPDPVPQEFLAGLSQDLPQLAVAYQHVHRPQDLGQARAARHRFAAQEALILQTLLARRRQRNRTAIPATAYPPIADGVLAHLDAQLPFELTAGQHHAGAEIEAELNSQQPMSRLLQGEVGSGKTVVALRAMTQVVDAGAQAVLVAPTEVLAGQHYRSITATLGQLATAGQLTSWQGPATEVVLLTGSMTTGEKQAALLKITTGQAGIIIATHAIFSDNVHFADLGLVVIDEQHRFGVDQREALRQANPGVHMLVMTATPIPRSVAMTVFGDLDVTVLEGLPSGRHPVTTHLARIAHGPRIIQRVWEIIGEEISAGHQAFVVCPKIDPSDTNLGDTGDLSSDAHAANVADISETLSAMPLFANATVATLHGRQDQATQDEIMGEFVAGQIDILVATTIIEVGVDVPNATVMAILDPEYFGLSTLHQLRGRVGRGTAAARCFLATRLPDAHPSLERLAVIERTEDGFEIAKADVEHRGEGDVLGAAQHGYGSQLQVLKVIQHARLISEAATWVDRALAQDEHLTAYPQLVEAVQSWETAHENSSDYLEKN